MDETTTGSSVLEDLIQQEECDRIHKILSTLSEKDQCIIRYSFGLDGAKTRTSREIAQELKISIGAVRWRRVRILDKLRKIEEIIDVRSR
jgi:RNA polymerase sigma factor (sigma-70 family)